MSTVDASRMLRPGLLDGAGVLIAEPPAAHEGGEGLGDAVEGACAALDARVLRCVVLAGTSHERQEAASDEAVAAALAQLPSIDVLVVDAAGLFESERAGGGDSGAESAGAALLGCMQAAWTVTRAAFNLAFLPAQQGRVVYLAPRSDAGMHSGPALASLENLARTLSIEWSRHRVTAVTIAPGRLTPADEVAAIAAYLASPAGAYFSGCLLDLRGSS
jgi:NAD(P)-dependent dehydrogenase (short-subunit alcohol dehydrogenase family)